MGVRDIELKAMAEVQEKAKANEFKKVLEIMAGAGSNTTLEDLSRLTGFSIGQLVVLKKVLLQNEAPKVVEKIVEKEIIKESVLPSETKLSEEDMKRLAELVGDSMAESLKSVLSGMIVIPGVSGTSIVDNDRPVLETSFIDPSTGSVGKVEINTVKEVSGEKDISSDIEKFKELKRKLKDG